MIRVQSAQLPPGNGSDGGSDTGSLGKFATTTDQSVDASFGSDVESYSDDESTSSHMDNSEFFDADRAAQGAESEAGLKIAQREHQAVMIWKMVVMSVMILITIGVSVAVFVYVDAKEQENFESNFVDDTNKIFSDLGGGIVERFAQLDHMAIDMVSYANTSG
ncbi:MAG: hypothetical protein SGARI_000549, partial [Bacillariaceae sp.]